MAASITAPIRARAAAIAAQIQTSHPVNGSHRFRRRTRPGPPLPPTWPPPPETTSTNAVSEAVTVSPRTSSPDAVAVLVTGELPTVNDAVNVCDAPAESIGMSPM